MALYGYARVSTKQQELTGNGLEVQVHDLLEAGVPENNIYKDAATGATLDRPSFEELRSILKSGDTLVVTKLDRIARSASQGIQIVDDFLTKGISVDILNMGKLNNTPNGKLIRTVMLAFAEFEKDMIVERTQAGKAIARQKPGFKEGRPHALNKRQKQQALDLLKNHSYSEVAELTGVSPRTLMRYKACATKIS